MDIEASLPPEKMDFTADDREFHEIHIDGQERLHSNLVVEGTDVIEPESTLISDIQHSDPTNKKVMDTEDSVDAVPELNFSEVKEQMLKEVEEMKEVSSLQSNDGVVPDEDIEKLFNVKPVEDESALAIVASQMTEDQTSPKDDLPPEETLTANPDNISKDDVKAALDATQSMDVLVCGNCHLTFNFVEEFTQHKASCTSKSPFLGGVIEQKSTIWAFLLFKNALVTQNPQKYSGGLTESSWKLYQKWCKMPESVRNSWVTAGDAVMNFVAMGNLKKDGSKIVASHHLKGQEKSTFENDDPKRPVVMKKFCQRDQSGEVLKIRPGGLISQNDMRSSVSEDSEQGKSRMEDEDSQDVSSSTAPSKKVDMVREEEFVVERIVSRRFNPRRKQYEYLLKWEGYPPEQNTWEPAENLETCQHLLKAFEESLNKQGSNKMKSVPSRKSDYAAPSGSGNSMSNFGRPVRSSKQKALSQVKQWCGSIKPDEAEIESLMKRKLSPTDSDDDDDNFVGKRLRMGSDSEESIGGRGFNKGSSGSAKKTSNSSTPHRGPGRPRKYPQQHGLQNGTLRSSTGPIESSDEGDGKTLEILSHANVTKTLNLSPANQQVLVANAKGVVKVDPSQVPNLSSGVYIMSNKSGIIKLDSVSPSKALSMKQGIIKDITPGKNTSSSSQPSKSMVMLNKPQPSFHHEITPKSGIVRKTQITSQVTPRVPSTPSILPGAKAPVKQPRATGNIKINSPNPNTRFLHSGNRSNANVATVTTTSKPKTIIRTTEPQKKIMEMDRTLSSQNKVGRGGGILAGSLRGGRGGNASMRSGITKVTPGLSIANRDNIGVSDKGKVVEGKLIKQINQAPSDSESGILDDFPADIPPIVPTSASRPMSVCPETGSVLLKAEETIPQSSSTQVVSSTTTSLPTESDLLNSPIVIKEEYIEKAGSVESDQILQVSHQQQEDQQKPIRTKKELESSQPKAKESLVKRTLGKPGSIGSMTVSPKKVLPEIEDPDSDVVTISGEDGMIYKVSKAELNNSLLMAGEDGQQCVYLTTGENGDENATVITLDPSSYTEQVNQLGQQVNVLGEVGEEEATQYYVKEGEEGELMDIQMQGQEGDDEQSQLVAQLVEAGEPAPGGGPRRVVLLLPDGNLMMTEVDEEQYAALELDKFQGQPAEME